ncbi:hypothetical protein ACNR9Q_15760 [Maribacter sp. X9]|uniref:hypothetical protein n=1 Tax=Maribacter sp. X9 TaxID=3402159 RepID=UPI003AF380A4
MKQKFILFLFYLVGLCSFAQQARDSSKVHIDTSSVVLPRNFSKNIFQKYSGEEFNYTTKTGESQNLLARFLNWIGKGLYSIFGIKLSPQILQLLEYLIYGLMALLAIYLLVKMFTNERFNSLFTKKAKTLNDPILTEQHIETIDINNLLNVALENEDYRSAIRYQFLLTLQWLSKKDCIQWHYDKTNSDYLNEITSRPLQAKFKKIAYLYDHIWYGEQAIDQLNYEKIVLDFESINNRIPQ